MAYNQPFIKLTFGGTIANGQEEWNCGINLAVESAAIVPVLENYTAAFQAYVEDIDSDIVTIFSSYVRNKDMRIPANATLEYVKLALIGEDGLYVLDPVIWDIFDVNGGSAGPFVPQLSTVITLASRKRRDPGKYQRFYLPTVTPSLTGTYKQTGTSDMAELSAGLISTLQRNVTTTLTSYDVFPAAVTSSAKHQGPYLPIVEVRVGNIIDTQRRRRNKLTESYDVVPIPDNAPVSSEPEPLP